MLLCENLRSMWQPGKPDTSMGSPSIFAQYEKPSYSLALPV